jgi:ketosteroid isomerase-like protein
MGGMPARGPSSTETGSRRKADAFIEGGEKAGSQVSEEHVEIVRRIYAEGLIDRDPKRLVDEFASPDIEYVDPPDDADPGSRHGRTEVMLALRRARQSFATYEHQLQELFDGGDTVVVAVTFRATARRAGSKREDIQEEQAHIWTLRDGQVIRFENGRDLNDALEAAGLSK